MTHPLLPDLIALSLISISVLISLVRGLVRELISVVSWVLAAWLSIRYSNQIAHYITFTEVQSLRVFLAFLLIFVAMVFLGAVVNFMVGQLVRKTPFSAADRILGMVFGAVRGVLVLSVLVLLGGLTPLPKDDWWQQSYAIARVQKVAIWMQSFLPSEVSQYFDFSPTGRSGAPHQKIEKIEKIEKTEKIEKIEKKTEKIDRKIKKNKKDV